MTLNVVSYVVKTKVKEWIFLFWPFIIIKSLPLEKPPSRISLKDFLSMITCAREEIIVNRNIFKKVADINTVYLLSKLICKFIYNITIE